MTTYNVANAKHATLGAAAEDIVNLSSPGRTVTIVNWGALTDVIYFRVGAAPGSQASPGPIAPAS